jgi:cell division protein FtsI (penicillin-binding protein 3)
MATGAGEGRLLKGFNGKAPYVLVARQLTPDVQEKVMRLGLPGLEFEEGAKRYYPNARATAQLLGVTDPDGNGVSGLEKGLNDALHDAEGPVATSIDMRVQYILAAEAEASMKMFRAKAAGGVVMDVKSGEVLGLISLPDFDPNQRSFGPGDSARNIMTQDVYELGSVFKVFTITLALEDGTSFPDQIIPVGSGLKIGKYTIREAEKMDAYLPMREVLAQSSNIGSAQIAMRSGPARQREFLSTMGLLSPLKTNLPEIARPLYPKSNWGTIETATIGFGHGIGVSPLSYAAAAASVVNGGRKIVPTFVKSPGDNRGEQVIKPETSAKMRELLRYVVTNGTGRKADIPGYNVGGKTGSAEKPGKHGYQEHSLVTSFFATFPAEDPRYVVFVMLDEPHGTKETFGFALAGYTAAPMAGRIISRIAPLLGVPNRAPPVALAQTGL